MRLATTGSNFHSVKYLLELAIIMARLELKGIDNKVREDVKVLAKTHGVTVAKFLEPAIRNYIYRTDNRERLIRAKRSDPDW